ncbi:tripartite tricarboxylate transporter TctB family protein [Thalassobacillus sp. CUG 92003]|uniref:tripartite tricarboxylate transporter TctB family protein n=1 Tax=Thalassobacillus sp. CUG 92003 TaxID=2736641 RepID=UPI0015E74493|nr:tripartite tricarboxylate transporter TctB family protein [Thalassobacillus sp. CUG 92003]
MSTLIKHSVASILVLVFAIVFYIESLKLPETAARLPQVIIIVIAFLAVAMFVEAFIKRNKTKTANNEAEGEDIEKINVIRLLVFGAAIALYIFLINIIGYLIITPIFSFLTLMYLKATKLRIAILLSIGFTAFIYGLFVEFLSIPIPMGILA